MSSSSAQKRCAQSQSKAVEWKEGKVFFCCDNCSGAFSKNKEAHAVKANAQLVSTKQYKQQACPVSGAKLDESKSLEVGGVKVTFCCDKCKGSVESKKGDEQMSSVFGEEAFKKAKFELVKEEKK